MRPDGHPDEDLLADLAADVLPADQARSVEAHVGACPRCNALLEDSERIRALLLADDPGPMPADVAARIEAAIGAQWEQPVAAPSAARRSPSAFPAEQRARSGVSRRRSGQQRTRRQVLEEERDARPSRVGRWLAVAAGVTVLALGGAAVLRWGPGQGTNVADSGAAASSAKSGAGAPAHGVPVLAVPVLATGTDYTAARFAAQARALITRAPSLDTRGSAAPTRGAAEPRAEAAPPSVSPGSAFGGNSAGQTLRDPGALAACLQAINAAGVRPIAVDLATYQGREAAILVLPGQGGGYEVWAVARDCRPGADGTMHFIAIR